MSRVVQSIVYNNPDTYPPIVNSTRLLAQAGYRIDILCRDNGERWQVAYPPTAAVQRIDTRSPSSLKTYAGFLRQVWARADGRACVFVGHDMHGFLPAKILGMRYHRPVIYHCHDYADHAMPLAWGGRLVKAFERHFARTADVVIVPDRERSLIVMAELQLKRPPIVAANAPLSGSTGDGEVLRRSLADRGKCFGRILFRQGKIGRGHAIEATLKSMPSWASREWGFVVMGWTDAGYPEELNRLAHSLGVEGQFVILPPVGYDEVAQFTAGADVGHALYEPIHVNNIYIATASNKTMEYMAAGLPLLVSNRPATRVLVDEWDCGLAADEGSPESIAAAVNAFFGDPALARRMGAAAKQAFETVYCYERQYAPVLDALRSLADRPARERQR